MLSDEMIFRSATQKDRNALLALEQGIINAERPFDVTLKRENTSYYDFDALISSDDSMLLVAELRGVLIATGYARIENAKPYLQHRRHAYLGFMYVVPEHRGKGINGEIMERLKMWAREKGITELRLEVYAANQPAISAYEKIGFERHMIEMRMSTK